MFDFFKKDKKVAEAEKDSKLQTASDSASSEKNSSTGTETNPETRAEIKPKSDTVNTSSNPIQAGGETAKSQAGMFSRLKKGLNKTREILTTDITELVNLKRTIDDELLEEIETHLLMGDVGMEATMEIIDDLNQRVAKNNLQDAEALFDALQENMLALLEDADKPLQIDTQKSPYVILMVGINGAGKTTTIGKLAKKFQHDGYSVMLAAGDTFRAAAVEQLQVWGERNNIPVIAQQTGADSASVIYDAIAAGKARNIDIVIADTAGRLHTQSNLMDELSKVKRVAGKIDATAPHEVMLVLDAGTGQNALNQAEQFNNKIGVTGLTLTKLDGTAKGGIIFAIAKKLSIPIRFIGVGESIEDLRPFERTEFVRALLNRDAKE